MPQESLIFKRRWQTQQKDRIKFPADANSFIYLHVTEDTGLPFYVGMGCQVERPWNTRRNYNKKYTNKVHKHGVRVEIIEDELSWESALWWEQRWIKALNSIGYDLANLTEGGEGTKGYKHSEISRIANSARQKGKSRPDISDRLKGKVSVRKGAILTDATKLKISQNRKGKGIGLVPWNRGKETSDCTKEKLRITNSGSRNGRAKSVIELNDNRIFLTIKEAALYYNICRDGIVDVCLGRKNSVKQHRFAYVRENT